MAKKTPETETAGADKPEVETPEAATEAPAAETAEPEPEAAEAEAAEPEAAEAEAAEPEAAEPEAAEPVEVEPEAVAAVEVEPETAEPEVETPEAEPAAAEIEALEAAIDEPEAESEAALDEPVSVSDFADLGALAGEPPAPPVGGGGGPPAPLREQELDAQGRAYATGRRKDAVARVWLKPGSGKVTVNGRDQEVFFARPTLRLIIAQPFQITDRVGQYDVVCTVSGGGLSGQAGAVKHGISQALAKFEPALRSTVKAAGFLTRDSRVVERKKYGRAKARRSFQFSKR